MYQPTPLKEYIVTPHYDDSWDVYNDEKGSLYRVNKREGGKFVCNCPHWYYRLRVTRGQCRHIQAVKREESKQ